MTVAASFAATLVDEWVRAGLTDAVLSPGSRSTPLAVSLARDGRIALHVRLDERSAAFFAVGIGLATGRPAVLVTTSGTAAVEVHSAVVEAHQARVPLIAVSYTHLIAAVAGLVLALATTPWLLVVGGACLAAGWFLSLIHISARPGGRLCRQA